MDLHHSSYIGCGTRLFGLPYRANCSHAFFFPGRCRWAHDAFFPPTPSLTNLFFFLPESVLSSWTSKLSVLVTETVWSPHLFVWLAGRNSFCTVLRLCVTQIMRVDLCCISQLLQFQTIKWDIPADPFIEAHSELQDREFRNTWPLTAAEAARRYFFIFCLLSALVHGCKSRLALFCHYDKISW